MKLAPAFAGLAIGALALLGIASPVSATNPGTESGNSGEGCEVGWEAASVLDTDLTHDDVNYPGLMQDLNGNPTDYSNGGYISAVEPALGDPGYLELNHFYIGAQTQVWRIPTATDYPIKDASVTFTLGAGYEDLSQYDVSFDPTSTNSTMQNWGAPYSNYTWTPRDLSAATQNVDGTWTIELGDLPAFGGTVYQFNIRNADGSAFTTTDQYVAHASLSGNYLQGVGCELPAIPNPEPTPGIGECQVEFLGTTIWNRESADITDRIKVHDGEETDITGEVNADGWGSGATRTFRVYGGTRDELTNARYEVKAIQGFTFDTASISVIATPGGGALQGNGLTEAIEGAGTVEVLEDGTLALEIAHMPANSSFSFNVTGVLDDSTDAMVLHHRLLGDDPHCEPTVPPTDPEVPPTDPEVPPTDPELPTNDPDAPVSPEKPAGPAHPAPMIEDDHAATPASKSVPTQLAHTAGASSIGGAVLGALLAAGGALLVLRRRATRQ